MVQALWSKITLVVMEINEDHATGYIFVHPTFVRDKFAVFTAD